jgi:hypothetical protein
MRNRDENCSLKTKLTSGSTYSLCRGLGDCREVKWRAVSLIFSFAWLKPQRLVICLIGDVKSRRAYMMLEKSSCLDPRFAVPEFAVKILGP